MVDNSDFSGATESLLNSYYTFFHKAHPCALPRMPLARHLETDPLSLKPVYLVIQYIGSLYMPSVSSTRLEALVLEALAEDRPVTDKSRGFIVQALVLYSIAVYWCDEVDRGKNLLANAIAMAVEIGMNLRAFAVEHGCGDVFLEESWRRTWWLIQTTDAHISGGTHSFPFQTSGIAMSVDLPCEEDDYETGVRSHGLIETFCPC